MAATATQPSTDNIVGSQNRLGASQQNSEVQRHSEGKTAKTIEDMTAQIPSDTYLWAAGGAICGSVLLQAMGKQNESLFVGQWAPTLLILGLYNKLVKVAGSDRASH